MEDPIKGAPYRQVGLNAPKGLGEITRKGWDATRSLRVHEVAPKVAPW